MIGRYENGERIINEDEKVFLERVEEGDGEIHEIAEGLMRFGEITDDLTLVRIAFREDFPIEPVRANEEFKNAMQRGRSLHH